MERSTYGIRKIKYGDLIAVLLVVAVAVLSMWLIARASAGDKGEYALVEVKGKRELKLPLGPGLPEREYTVRGWIGESTLVRDGGRIRLRQSDCRDKICVGTGWIDSPGQTIVCLPNRVVVTVTSTRKGGVDTVTR